MVKISEELKEIIRNNISNFATASKDGKPNVIQVRLAKAISDTELLIVDVFFRKTRENLEENTQVSLAVMDMRMMKAYQLKGKAEIISKGELFEKAFEIMREKTKVRMKNLQEIAELARRNPELAERVQRLRDMHEKKKPKAAVLMRVEEIYSTIPGERYKEE